MNFLLEPGIAIYMAMLVALAVWMGIFVFLWRLDRQAREIRRRLDQQADPIEPVAPRIVIETRSANHTAASGSSPHTES
ncbi:MAG TPA: CcmD family protein [Roseiflexaceae bacterium]|nr:CcmD family protein [Roseiflexaceae bacterium]HMP40915.1 CcmD family protein [Roseiflexaceae bacterium]